MKAVCLIQPWASLVVHGVKKFETRSWATKYRGPLLICASAKIPTEVQLLCGAEPFFSVLRSILNFPASVRIGALDIARELPKGGIVGRVTVTECYNVESMPG